MTSVINPTSSASRGANTACQNATKPTSAPAQKKNAGPVAQHPAPNAAPSPKHPAVSDTYATPVTSNAIWSQKLNCPKIQNNHEQDGYEMAYMRLHTDLELARVSV